MRSQIKKMPLWFITFALIMACVPAVVTPVPTLDPNAINTIIVQTANVAATRTASVPTFTAIATLQNTSTPESTFTPVQPIIFPSSTGIPRLQYYRVKHDSQLEAFNYKSRTIDSSWPVDLWGLQTPEVFRMSVRLKSKDTRMTTMEGIWDKYIDALNGYDKKKIGYIKADNTALFNGKGFPQMESLTMGGNIITLDEIRDGWGRVHTLNYNNPEPFEDINYVTRPDLIHKFVVVGWKRSTKTTILVNPPPGDLYWPLVASGTVWMSLENLEPFPPLPLEVTANTAQAIRRKPSMASSQIGTPIADGDTLTVVDYYPSASNVWGRLAGGGWIALLLHEEGPSVYLTSWKMETKPPIPPAQ
jgi:hypothetical protein